jgi:hypothetical protein
LTSQKFGEALVLPSGKFTTRRLAMDCAQEHENDSPTED